MTPPAKLTPHGGFTASISLSHKKRSPGSRFFRGDDVEWSWRNFGRHHISINGICVWHAPFIWRVSKPADYYYLPRNMFFINVLYTADFKKHFKDYLIQRLKYLTATYDYASLDLLIKAMKDILNGSAVFRENPENSLPKSIKLPNRLFMKMQPKMNCPRQRTTKFT